ncbi:hypothetical protein [Limnohabitans sp. Rim28]|jgi:hypothetical protein|uniref:hypothetical protein n=1 Tax=Limnohabitans sp. Rim28 TaxID=1100720 RepID=UPI00031E8066|nr:hypothetical protein [Limnohabitans sp. Rim28]PVE06126.1 hypothetical protein B472_12765 [Limnohabitans sp. Rim28]
MRWIDRIPKWLLVALAIYLAGAPFVPEPHLVEKWRMLFEGHLSRPIDIFDFFLHTLPLVVLAIRLWRDAQRRRWANQALSQKD